MIPGIDILKENSQKILKNRNVVLVTGSANVDSSGEPVYRVVKQVIGEQLKAIWSLQHGFFIDKQDNMILSHSFYWEELGLPIRSLYGSTLLPEEEWLTGIDALLIDIFDVGTRVYTFVNHVLMIMKAISGRDISIIVLDRPNPLNGLDAEGSVMSPEYFSIVGQIPVPMRHSLTAGEYLSYGMNYYNIDLSLEVVLAKKWSRDHFFSSIWTYPSPNMPALATAIVYPGAVLFEGTTISEGRGTTRPFELIGAPFIDHQRLVTDLAVLYPQYVTFIPVFFKPEFSKYAGQVCKGVFFHVEPRFYHHFRSFQVYYEVLRWLQHHHPGEFQWKQPPYEFEYQRWPIDMICGGEMIRLGIEKNCPFQQLASQIEDQINQYQEVVSDYILY